MAARRAWRSLIHSSNFTANKPVNNFLKETFKNYLQFSARRHIHDTRTRSLAVPLTKHRNIL